MLHPLHANARSLDNPTGVYNPNTHLAFVGTGERSIDIFDTFHFFRSGRIFIRDVVSGPLCAVLPFPSDNVGLRCQGTDVTDVTGGRSVGSPAACWTAAAGTWRPWPWILSPRLRAQGSSGRCLPPKRRRSPPVPRAAAADTRRAPARLRPSESQEAPRPTAGGLRETAGGFFDTESGKHRTEGSLSF